MYRFIDSLPIEPEDIERSQSSIENNSNYLEQLRFVHKCISTIDRVAELQSFLSKKTEEANDENFLSLYIESSLLSLLYTSSITNTSRFYRSPHYLSRTHYITPVKSKPPTYYLKEIALSNLRTWGGMYGMPSFSLHLEGDTNHYLLPYEIADRVINYYLNLLSTNTNWIYISNYDYLSDNANPYDLSHLLIRDDPEVLSTYEVMWSISNLVPKLLDEYVKEEKTLSNYMRDLVKLLILYGADSNIRNLHYNFIHQSLGKEWDDLFPEIIRLRKRAPSVRDELEEEFISSIPITTKEDLYRVSSNKLLSWLCPPGGYNMYLLIISLSLLNRAYILSTERKLIEASKNIYLAGVCLRKSNLPHIQKLANNFVLVSNQTYLPISTDLLQ